MDSLKVITSNEAKIILRTVAALQLYAGVVGGLALFGPWRVLLGLAHPLGMLYALLTVANLVGGILLWRLHRTGWILSLLLGLAQIPYYASARFPYNPLGLHFVIKAGWLAREGMEAYELGINLVALGLSVILWIFWPKSD